MGHALTTPPSPWVSRWAPLFAPTGKILDIACGDGRHMEFLNGLGLEVTGVDRNAEALKMAARFGTVMQYDLENQPWPFPDAQFDGIVITNYLWRPLFAKIQESLKPGGFLIYETFASGNETLGKPSNPAFLLNTLELISGFPQLVPIAYESGLLNTPPRLVQRVCAYRPNPFGTSLNMVPLMDSLKCVQLTH